MDVFDKQKRSAIMSIVTVIMKKIIDTSWDFKNENTKTYISRLKLVDTKI